ncbi:MAG: DUF4386 domain-containing protein [Colwellia sp.]|nr:DUF4386 domain-containing protein [Colwellia sp.]
MYTNKKSGVIVGILFLFVFVTSLYGSNLVESLMYDDNYLAIAFANKTTWMLGLIIHFLSAAATIGIVMVMFPLLKQQSIYLAIGYIIFRSLEALMFVLTEIHSIPVLILSQLSSNAAPESIEMLKLMGDLFQETRSFSYIIGLLFFCIGSLMFYYSMFKSEIMPKWLTIWGIIAIIMAFIISTLNLFNVETPTFIAVIFYIPIALNEIIMSVWLIVKGFNNMKEQPI